jgi:hypothetical protein
MLFCSISRSLTFFKNPHVNGCNFYSTCNTSGSLTARTAASEIAVIKTAKSRATSYENCDIPTMGGGGDYRVGGITTRYGLDSPGMKTRLGRDFLHPSRRVQGPTKPLTKLALLFLPEGKAAGAWQ